MPKANLNQQSKRQRTLAKQDKRAAKDTKRAQRKADDRDARGTATPAPPLSPTALAAAAFIRRMKK